MVKEKPEDYNRYQALTAVMRQIRNENGFSSTAELPAEYQEAWSEVQEIQERNGGHPPTKP